MYPLRPKLWVPIAAILILTFVVVSVALIHQHTRKKETGRLLAVSRQIQALQGTLEQISDEARPQPLSQQIDIPVSHSSFEKYQQNSKRLTDQLGGQVATLLTWPGEVHLFLRLPLAYKNSILKSLTSGSVLSFDSIQDACPKEAPSLLEIVIRETP